MKKEDMRFESGAFYAMRDAAHHFRKILSEKTLEIAKEDNREVATKSDVMKALCKIMGKS